jgi:DNA polymerase-4
LVDRVTRRMRRAGRTGRTVVLRMRFDDFTRAARSHTLPRPTSHTPTILRGLRTLLAANLPMIEQRGLTLLGVAVMNLDNDGFIQLELPFEADSGVELDSALDRVRDRFGSSAITRAALLGRDPGISLPMLPD